MSLNNLLCDDPCHGAVLSTGPSPNIDIQGWGSPGWHERKGLPVMLGREGEEWMGGWGVGGVVADMENVISSIQGLTKNNVNCAKTKLATISQNIKMKKKK